VHKFLKINNMIARHALIIVLLTMVYSCEVTDVS